MLTNSQPLMRALLAARSRLADSLTSERGAGLAEYALLLILVTVVVAVVATNLGTTIRDAFQSAIDVF